MLSAIGDPFAVSLSGGLPRSLDYVTWPPDDEQVQAARSACRTQVPRLALMPEDERLARRERRNSAADRRAAALAYLSLVRSAAAAWMIAGCMMSSGSRGLAGHS